MLPNVQFAQRQFDTNRAIGRVAFSVEASRGVTRRTRTEESGPLRVRFPNSHSRTLEAVLMNTGGGIAGGDNLSLSMDVGRGARLMAGTAAAEKVYRSHGPDANFAMDVRVGSAGHLSWLPQETILFDGARFSRKISIDLAADASLFFVESQIMGRAAMDETLQSGAFRDGWRVRRDGRLLFAENARLSGNIAEKLTPAATGGGAVALATAVIAPCDEAKIETWRSAQGGFKSEAAISMWNGIAVARFCARNAADLRHDLMLQMAVLKIDAPRLWLQ